MCLLMLAVGGAEDAASADGVEPAPAELQFAALELLNQERADAGLPPLAESAAVNEVALARAVEMASTGYFSHVSPTGRAADQLLAAHGISSGRMGENIARSNEAAPQVVLVVHWSLMNSDGHRANVLDPEFRSVGIGIAQIDDTFYFAMVFTDVEE